LLRPDAPFDLAPVVPGIGPLHTPHVAGCGSLVASRCNISGGSIVVGTPTSFGPQLAESGNELFVLLGDGAQETAELRDAAVAGT
jgi:hypothetical protein